ncbi:MAG TPA: hypothetical protein VH255_03860 [Verrucomicrobiae bacterium]|nr:hypothetical protein [Verrucomicrobiae bacterium]
MKKTGNIALLGLAIIPLLVGCNSTQVVLDQVGPAPNAYASTGGLRVFTATETREVGDNDYYYPHTSYRIYTQAGKFWKYVPNHLVAWDQSADLVKIPAGHYLVTAKSESYGVVTVPVSIRADKTTEVHLESRWKIPPNVSTNEVVYLPNGDPVGWKSAHPHD